MRAGRPPPIDSPFSCARLDGMRCQECHLGQEVKGLIDKYTCGLDHSDEKKVRNGWDGCDIVESVRAREHASRLVCPECGCHEIVLVTSAPMKRTITERISPLVLESKVVDSTLTATGQVERVFVCKAQACQHSWPVPEWFPKFWVGKPEDAAHMTIEELAAHLKEKIIGGLGIPRRYLGVPDPDPKPVPQYADSELLTAQAMRDTFRNPELEARVLDALYEECARYMPQERGEVEQAVFGPGRISTAKANELADAMASGHNSGSTSILHERMAGKLRR